MFTVYDSKAESHIKPFTMLSTGEAIRGFITTLNDNQSDMSLYPSDFTLFEIGEYNPRTAEITPNKSLINLGNGLHLKAQGNDKKYLTSGEANV